jgi:hypothetical protein
MAFRGTGGIDRAARDKCGGGERDGPETDHDYGRCWYFGPAALVIDFVRLRREAKATKLVHGVERVGGWLWATRFNKLLSSFYESFESWAVWELVGCTSKRNKISGIVPYFAVPRN